MIKSTYLFFFLVFFVACANAQVGIGTVSPTSTLDIRGSLSAGYRSFTGSTSASSNDFTLAFTGTAASTVTLPDASTCTGRVYLIKNASVALPVPMVTVNTVSSQTIDGISSWLLDQAYESVVLVSNGTNWHVSAQSAPSSPVTGWAMGGNNTTFLQNFGTTSNFDLPFITNSTEWMRLSATGNLGIGTSTFNATNPEKLVVNTGTTSSVNAIVGKGSINNYLQLNIQNSNPGANASSDVVATADNGSETSNYVDLGINSSANTSAVMGNANDAYLYNIGQNFLIGTGAASKALIFMTGGTTQSSNERMRIDGTGNVGIGTGAPAYKLHVSASANPLYLGGVQTGANGDSLLTILNGVVRKLSPSALTVSSSNAWSLIGNASTNPSINFLGTTDAQPLLVRTNNTQVGRLDQNSLAFGIGSTINNSTHSYALGSNAYVGYNHSNAYAIGSGAAVNTNNSYSIGDSAVTNGVNSFAIGNNAAANNINSLAIGWSAVTAYSITDAIAIGSNATTNASNSISIGSNATLANRTVTNAANAIAIGSTAATNSASSIAIGNGATVSYSLSPAIAIGNAATTSGNSGVAIGNGANIGFVNYATVIGSGASATSTAHYSTALGYNASATLANEIILGDRSNTGLSVGIGTETFSGTNREKLLVDGGTSTSVNSIVGRANNNNYLQLNIQNLNPGTNASSDVVATADNGNETSNFVDLGVNSSANTSGVMGNANDAYLYNVGQNFLIGTGAASKALIFLTGGTTQSTNERMRIDGLGNVGIGNISPSYKLDVNGTIRTGYGSATNGSLIFSNATNNNLITFNTGVTTSSYSLTLPTAQGGASTVLTNDGTGVLSWNTVSAMSGAWSLLGNAGTNPATNFIGTTDNQSLVFRTNNQLSGKIDLPLNNSLFGYQAGIVSTGNNNTFIGYQSGLLNTSGLSNTSIGSNAMVANIGGGGNAALGYAALKSNTTGGSNTAVGNSAGFTNTTGANNTFIGSGADATTSGLSNAIALGYNAKVASSNSLILGGTGTSAVNVGIGTNTFNATNPEKLIVNAGTTSSVNAIVGAGSINNYLQLNIQNSNAGTNASSDVVATSDNGNETINYVDLGINSSVNTSGVMGNANDAYLYTTGNNFLIGTGTASKALVFLTGGTTQSSNERMRIDGSGNVGIGTTTPGNKLEVNSGTGGASGLRLKQLPQGAVLFMSSTADVAQNNNNFYFDATNYRLSVAAGTSPSSTLQDGGSFATAIVTKTASYTASVSDHTIICNNASGAITITLPAVAGCAGRIYVIKKTSALGNNVTLQGNSGTETIDGSNTQTLITQYSSYMIQSDGTSWFILSKN